MPSHQKPCIVKNVSLPHRSLTLNCDNFPRRRAGGKSNIFQGVIIEEENSSKNEVPKSTKAKFSLKYEDWIIFWRIFWIKILLYLWIVKFKFVNFMKKHKKKTSTWSRKWENYRILRALELLIHFLWPEKRRVWKCGFPKMVLMKKWKFNCFLFLLELSFSMQV